MGTKRNIALEKQEYSSQIGVTNRYLVPQPFNSTDAIIIIDDDDEEKETIEPEKKKKKKKKPNFVSWWDDVESLNIQSCLAKGLPKAKENDAASSVGLCFSSSGLHESYNHKENQDRVGYGHVSLEELGVTVEDLKSMPWEAFDLTWEIRSETMDPWLGGYVRDIMDSSLSTSTTDLHETKTKKKKDGERSFLSALSHQDNFVDLTEDESVGGDEGTSSSHKGNGHVSLEYLGVSVEDLIKSTPWEALDPTWEIRSETMDPLRHSSSSSSFFL